MQKIYELTTVPAHSPLLKFQADLAISRIQRDPTEVVGLAVPEDFITRSIHDDIIQPFHYLLANLDTTAGFLCLESKSLWEEAAAIMLALSVVGDVKCNEDALRKLKRRYAEFIEKDVSEYWVKLFGTRLAYASLIIEATESKQDLIEMLRNGISERAEHILDTILKSGIEVVVVHDIYIPLLQKYLPEFELVDCLKEAVHDRRN